MSVDVGADATTIEEPEPRTFRALQEDLSVVPGRLVEDARDDSYVVYSGHDRYEVDLIAGACECPDCLHRGARCKHLRVTAIWTGERSVPAWVEPEGLGDFLRVHLEREGRL